MMLLAAFAIGLVSAFFTSIVGGAAGLIAVPLFLLLGLPLYSAVSLPKAGAVGISIGSLFKLHGKGLIRWELMPILVILAVAAGILGAQALLLTPENIVENAVIVLLFVSVAMFWSKKDLGVVSFVVSKTRKFFGYVVYFFTEAFRAAFGSGFGMLTGVSLTYFFGLTNLESLATKRVPGFLVTVSALIVFLIQGVIDIQLGIAMFFGSIIGGYLGTHYAILLGNKWIKYLFSIFAVLMAIALLVF